MTPEYLSTEAAAAFCGAPNAKAFRERMYRAGFRPGKWGMWKVDVLRALMDKPRRRHRGLQSHPSPFQQRKGTLHGSGVSSQSVAQVHAEDSARDDAGVPVHSMEQAR